MKRYYIYVTWTAAATIMDEPYPYDQNCFVDLDLKTMSHQDVIDEVVRVLKITKGQLRGPVRIKMMVKA